MSSEDKPLYQFHQVPESLKPFVRGIVFASHDYIEYKVKVAPTGYVYLGRLLNGSHKSIKANVEGQIFESSGANHLSGQVTNSRIETLIEGIYHHFLVEFTATGFYELFHLSPKMFNDMTISVASILPELNDKIESHFGDSLDVNDHIQSLEALIGEYSADAAPIPEDIKLLVSELEAGNGALKISKFYDSVTVSPRYMAEKFEKFVGLKPKEFSRVMQLNYAINLLNSGMFETLTEMALEAGYFDQPHFVRHIKERIEATPKDLRKNPGFDVLKTFLGRAVENHNKKQDPEVIT